MVKQWRERIDGAEGQVGAPAIGRRTTIAINEVAARRTATETSFLIVGEGEEQAGPMRRICAEYGVVHRAGGVEDALRTVAGEAGLATACVVWSNRTHRFLEQLALPHCSRTLSLLVSCSIPTTEVVRQIFRMQEVGFHHARLTCAPVGEGELRTFIEASVGRKRVAGHVSDPIEYVRCLGKQAGLTPRELQVLLSAVSGVERGTLARRLQIAPSTLRTHVRSVLGKFAPHHAARSMAELVSHLLRHASK
jgi:DNA-binding CsgD family transcriptional regulator